MAEAIRFRKGESFEGGEYTTEMICYRFDDFRERENGRWCDEGWEVLISNENGLVAFGGFLSTLVKVSTTIAFFHPLGGVYVLMSL